MRLIFTLSLLLVVASDPIRKRRETAENASSDEPTVKSLHSVSTIRSRFANTVIVSVLENPSEEAKLATFTATLPDDAFISNFSMTIKDKIIVGAVKEKEEAKEAFDQAVSRGQSAGHVAQRARETNIFDISVNVGAKESVKFELTYQEVLQRIHGVYKHTVNIGAKQVIPDLRVHVSLAESRKITTLHVPEVAVKQSEKQNKDLVKLPEAKQVTIEQTMTDDGSFAEIDYRPTEEQQKALLGEEGLAQLVLLYDVERSDDAGELLTIDGYFVHFFAPKSIDVAPKRIVFVIDISGSMAGTKLQQTKDAMETILNDLNEDDSFNLVIFDDDVEQWALEFQPRAKVPSAIEYVKQLRDDGGTNINDAMLEAIRQFEGKTRTGDTIIFLTDGQATSGITGNDEILSNIKKELSKTAVPIHTISFGDGADYDLLKSISLLANGLAKKVYEDSDSAMQMEGFYAQIGSPLLSDVKIKYLNASLEPDSLVSNSAYNLYEGSEIVTLGKLASNDAQIQAEADALAVGGERRVLNCLPIPMPRCVNPLERELDTDIEKLIWRPPHCYPWPPMPNVTTERPVPNAKTLAGYLERMWAKKTIDKLLEDEKYGEGKSEKDKKEMKKKALDLSLKYNFVTQLTSMVVIQGNETKTIGEPIEDHKDFDGFGGGFKLTAGSRSNSFNLPGLPGPGGSSFGSGGGGFGGPSSSGFIGAPPPPARPAPTFTGDQDLKTEEEELIVLPAEPDDGCGHSSRRLLVNGVHMYDCPTLKCPIGYECHNGTCCSKPDLLDAQDVHQCPTRHAFYSPCKEYEYTCVQVRATNSTLEPFVTSNPTCSMGGCVCLDSFARNEDGDCVPHSRC